ncbi:MAG: RNA-binding domain-containing protein [Chloroflexota bacterium]
MAKKKSKLQWYHVDLHLHTPGSMDYQSTDASYLDILQKAEAKNLDIIAFTDHNTVRGYAEMMREIDWLRQLKEMGRAQSDEVKRLSEYERLLDKILVLPGFEFTATFGFHILGLFSPQKTVRELEHLLMTLNVPVQAIEEGNSEVGASSDVIRAYELIHEAGGIVIAAHANASHGVAMRGMDFGGQTRIAYTQDDNLHALEVTDLGSNRRGSTQRFFNGTKPEYPRKMRCIQGSDAHALETVTDRRGKNITLGVGERTTEVLLSDKSFDALLEMFKSNDFSRSRIFEGGAENDYVQQAREEGVSIVQSFHESMQRKGGHLYAVVSDVCGFANTNGGTVYVGLTANPKDKVTGVGKDANKSIDDLQQAIGRMISPELTVEIDSLESNGANIIRAQVPKGNDAPYAVDEYKIYVRDDNETTLAVRDEIVSLVLRGGNVQPPEVVTSKVAVAPEAADESKSRGRSRRERKPKATEPESVADAAPTPADGALATENHALPPEPDVTAAGASGAMPTTNANVDGIPRAGVEIIGTESRNGTTYHIMRDLRNGNIVHNVTRESARRLWHYAIKQRETNPVDILQVNWSEEGDIGLWRSYRRGNDVRYDLVKRRNDKLRVFYGVSEAGMDGRWQQFLEPDDN